MFQFKTLELDCKFLSLTVSHRYKLVYITFTAFEDIKIDINSEVKQILIKKFEKAKLKLQFSDFTELDSLPSILTNKKTRLSVIVKYAEGHSVLEIDNSSEIKTSTDRTRALVVPEVGRAIPKTA